MSSGAAQWSTVLASEDFDARALSDLLRSSPIPSSERSSAWKWLVSDRVKEDRALRKYATFLEKKRASKEISKEIAADVAFLPDERRAAVTNVLSAYCGKRGEFYFSGLHHLVSVLLAVLGLDDEEGAFQLLSVLLDTVLPRHYSFDVYGGNVSKLHALTFLSAQDAELESHLESASGRPASFLDGWFMKLCTAPLPSDVYLPFLDLLLSVTRLNAATDIQGEMVVVGFVTAILERIKPALMAASSNAELERAFETELPRLRSSDVFESAASLAFSIKKGAFYTLDSKVQTVLDGEYQSLDRALWAETTIDFGESPLSASLKKQDNFIVINRFKRVDGGGPGPAESSGKVTTGTAITRINGHRIKSKYDVTDVVKKIKEAERPLVVGAPRPPSASQITFQHTSAFSQSRPLIGQSIPSDNYMPSYLHFKEEVVQIFECQAVLFVEGGSFAKMEARLHDGRIVLTNYRLIYHYYPSPESAGLHDLQVPLSLISSLGSEEEPTFLVKTKVGQKLLFKFESKTGRQFRKKCSALAFPENTITRTFAFREGSVEEYPVAQHDGWVVYDPAMDYDRLGLLSCPELRLVVQGYDESPTYPSRYLVPERIDDSELAEVYHYRSRGRIPVAVYMHPVTHAILGRCAQPMTGLKGKRNSADERHVLALMASGGGRTDRFYVMDARSQIAAMGNRTMGKGTENPAYYDGMVLYHMNIANIHAARDSLYAMSEIFMNKTVLADDEAYLRKVSEAGWLQQVRSVLCAMVRSVEILEDEGCSLLSHCSDGWDRTAQMTSGAQLLCDPHYRTLLGFAQLIEKEWCSFGHQFMKRTGVSNGDDGNKDRSPIFLLFLDCLFQVLRQQPNAFEFNPRLLLFLADNLYSGRFGTFLSDHELQRMESGVKMRTVSIWTYLLDPSRNQEFLNAGYAPVKHSLRPSCHIRDVQVWEEFWCRGDTSFLPPRTPQYYY